MISASTYYFSFFVFRLTCRYLTENHPFLRLAPIKMEMMYLNPDVVVYYDVISDGEIEMVKKMARPRVSKEVAV